MSCIQIGPPRWSRWTTWCWCVSPVRHPSPPADPCFRPAAPSAVCRSILLWTTCSVSFPNSDLHHHVLCAPSFKKGSKHNECRMSSDSYTFTARIDETWQTNPNRKGIFCSPFYFLAINTVVDTLACINTWFFFVLFLGLFVAVFRIGLEQTLTFFFSWAHFSIWFFNE